MQGISWGNNRWDLTQAHDDTPDVAIGFTSKVTNDDISYPLTAIDGHRPSSAIDGLEGSRF